MSHNNASIQNIKVHQLIWVNYKTQSFIVFATFEESNAKTILHEKLNYPNVIIGTI